MGTVSPQSTIDINTNTKSNTNTKDCHQTARGQKRKGKTTKTNLNN